ncbi:MAG: hypothetical protein EXR95_02065 [Gemmatimonadetes bacterium]|nr:hypothetical protein [Gemmatimonadota bacterium]
MRRSLALTLALSATLLTLACGDGSPSGLATGGSGNVVIAVTSVVTPTFSWTGGNARRLTVTSSSGAGIYWDVETLNATTGFRSPAVHGVVTSGARENSPDVQLIQGTDFRLNVTIVDGSEGTRVFRP